MLPGVKQQAQQGGGPQNMARSLPNRRGAHITVHTMIDIGDAHRKHAGNEDNTHQGAGKKQGQDALHRAPPLSGRKRPTLSGGRAWGAENAGGRACVVASGRVWVDENINTAEERIPAFAGMTVTTDPKTATTRSATETTCSKTGAA